MLTVEAHTLSWPQTVAIIGSGTMGIGVAESFIAGGMSVRLVDATPELALQAIGRLEQRVRGHVEAGLAPALMLERVGRAQAVHEIPAAVQDIDLVFEAVPEQLELKRGVLSDISAGAPRDAIIASNTSSFPIDELAAAVRHPERFLGMHWFNPPEWTPCIEIIRGAATNQDVVERIRTFLQELGKNPVVIRSGPGFVANRIQFAMFREALSCVEDGLASPQEVDEIVRSSFGFRLPFFGPFLIADMAGLDVYASIFDTLERGLGERFQAPPILRELVEQGRMGVKSGAGFSAYTDDAREQLLLKRDRYYAALSALLAELMPADDR